MKKIMLLGDSISLDYRKKLFSLLQDKFDIYGKSGDEEAYTNLEEAIGSNCGDSSRLLAYIDVLENEQMMDFDVFIFNCGLHDIRKDKNTGQYQISPALYERNLYEIVTRMQKRGKDVVFINTTPTVHERYPQIFSYTRYGEDVDLYNQIAQKVMEETKTPIIDLNGFVKESGALDDSMFRDHTHFNPDKIKQQAFFLRNEILDLLERGVQDESKRISKTFAAIADELL